MNTVLIVGLIGTTIAMLKQHWAMRKLDQELFNELARRRKNEAMIRALSATVERKDDELVRLRDRLTPTPDHLRQEWTA